MEQLLPVLKIEIVILSAAKNPPRLELMAEFRAGDPSLRSG